MAMIVAGVAAIQRASQPNSVGLVWCVMALSLYQAHIK